MLETNRLMKLIDEYAQLFVADCIDEKQKFASCRKREEIKRELHQIEMKYTQMENKVRKARLFFPF